MTRFKKTINLDEGEVHIQIIISNHKRGWKWGEKKIKPDKAQLDLFEKPQAEENLHDKSLRLHQAQI
jgi:hypothetical protein